MATILYFPVRIVSDQPANRASRNAGKGSAGAEIIIFSGVRIERVKSDRLQNILPAIAARQKKDSHLKHQG